MTLEDLLAKNRELRDLHAGKRCFLVGNGPSLNSQDITLLRNEVAIVATSFFRHPRAKDMSPRYWVFADPFFWKDPEHYFLPAYQQALDKNISTRMFVPSGGFSFFGAFNRGPLIDLHFYHYDQSRDATTPIDFSSGIPPYGQNTMTVCLMLALYLGCNPVYFIGCDRDYWNMTKEEYESYSVRHFYDDPGQNSCRDHLSWEQWVAAKGRTEYEYEMLKQYAAARGIEIYNATPGGQFDQFPRVSYESLFPTSVDLLRTGFLDDARVPDVHRLGQAAVRLMNSGDLDAAVILIDAALRENRRAPQRVAGLRYLKAVCLARTGRYDEALRYAREDALAGPVDGEQSALLIRQLEEATGCAASPLSGTGAGR